MSIFSELNEESSKQQKALKPEQQKISTENLRTYEPTNVATEEQANIQTNEQPIVGSNTRLKMYLNIYTLRASKSEVKKGRYKPTNVEISDELRIAMDKLIAIYADGVVPNDEDKSYKDIIDNALYEYLTKKYKQLNNYAD